MLTNAQLRKSFPAKLTAIGFIGLILLGQFWLVYLMMGREGPQWIGYAMQVSLVAVILGGIGLLGIKLFGKPAAVEQDSLEKAEE